MLSAFSIVQNEATAAERTVFGIPFRDPAIDNQFATGLGFAHATAAAVDVNTGGHGAKEVEVWNGAAWVEAANNATEDGTSGNYVYVFSQAETNHAGRIGVRLSKTGYATAYFWVTIIPAANVPATGTALTAVAATINATLTTIAANLVRALGLLHENSLDDNFIYDADGNVTSCRKRAFATAGAVPLVGGAANGADGETARYTLIFTYVAQQLSTFRWTRDL